MAEKAYTMREATFEALTRARAFGFDSTAEALEKILADIDPPVPQQLMQTAPIMNLAGTKRPLTSKKLANVT